MKRIGLILILLLLIGFLIVALSSGSEEISAKHQAAKISAPFSARSVSFAEVGPISNISSATSSGDDPSGFTVREPGFANSVAQNAVNYEASLTIGTQAKASEFGIPMPEPQLSFRGLENLDNGLIYNLLFLPPDMTGDIGPGHYVQAVNSLFRVFNRSGDPVSPPLRLSTLFAPLNTVCSTRFDGLPNVLYDPLADRWLISQVCSAFPPFRQLIAVSKTGDPTGEFFAYEFIMPNVRINDFPKFGVWHDGYYMATDEFLGSNYVGSGMFAFDRAKMLAGDPTARYVYFSQSDPASFRRRGMLPSDLDGLRPPPENAPNTFASFMADEYGDPVDAILLYDFRPDFENPLASTFTERAESPILVPLFDPTSPPGRPDIEQPPPGERLDSQSDRLAHRLAYRNNGTHESLVFNQTIRMTPPEQTYRAGVRLYEFRRIADQYSLHISETAGDPTMSRWIGSAAQDHQGNLAVGYNEGSEKKRISIVYTGRVTSDPPGTLRTENTLIEGTGVQKAFGWRWGEYSGMSVDPVDDCTFWLTNAYYTLESEEFSDFGWLTQIGTFRFEKCQNAPRGLIAGSVTDISTGLPIHGAKIKVDAFSRSTSSSGTYGPLMALPGNYTATASADGYRSVTRNIVLPVGSISEDFALEPIPVAVETGNSIIGESCTINNTPEPGETVSIEISLRNEGMRNAVELTGELLNNDDITAISGMQNYGSLSVNSPPVTRTHTFRVNSGTVCGSLVTLRMRIREESEEIGSVEIQFRSGVPVSAFTENFDGPTAPGLPAGWTTSTTANHQLWRTSMDRRESEPNSAFSPAPIQMGVNELVSPVFNVATPTAELSFRNWYELETTFLRNRLYDGSVLEIKQNDGEWQDIITAGGTFLSGGYDGTIDTCCSNPLGGREGWSGRSGTGETSVWIDSKVRLPASATGSAVRLRWRIGTDIGTFREGQYIDNIAVTDGFACTCKKAVPGAAPFDFDRDGRTDLSLFRTDVDPGSTGFRVYESDSASDRFTPFGVPGDVPAVADFDGDGKADIAVFRPTNGVWYVLESGTSTISYTTFGVETDALVAADYDGDGRADLAVYRPVDGIWYLLQSSSGFAAVRFGLFGDLPMPADYDGDGRADIGVFRPSEGVWYTFGSTEGINIIQFGLLGDLPVSGDFDGDGKADRAVYRPSEGNWYLLRSSSGLAVLQFGLSYDIPLKGDFDGDGRIDIAVFRPVDNVWYHIRSSDSGFRADQFGGAGETPLPMPSYLSLTLP